MALTSSNKDIVSNVVTRNEAIHLLVTQLATDVTHNPAPVPLVIGVPFKVKGACHLSDPHVINGVDYKEDEPDHQVAPAILKDRLPSSLQHPPVLVFSDQASEEVGVLNHMWMCSRRHPLEAVLRGIATNCATADTVLALARHVHFICKELLHLISVHWLEEMLIQEHLPVSLDIDDTHDLLLVSTRLGDRVGIVLPLRDHSDRSENSCLCLVRLHIRRRSDSLTLTIYGMN